MAFDARAARSMAVDEVMTFPDKPGLRLTRGKKGHTWTYRYKNAQGALKQVKLGGWPAMSPDTAGSKWELARAARERGEDPAAQKREARTAAVMAEKAQRLVRHYGSESPTVRQICDTYVTGYCRIHRAPSSFKQVEWQLGESNIGKIADLPAASITRSDAFRLIDELSARGPILARRVRGELGAAWDYAIDRGDLPDTTMNFWRVVLRKKLKSKGRKINGKLVGTGKRTLRIDEIGQLINWMPNFTESVADALTLYLWTGARGAEIVQMRRSLITVENGVMWWTTPKADSKNRKIDRATDLRVPLIGRAEEVVRRRMLQVEGDYLFPSRQMKRPHLTQANISVAVERHRPDSTQQPGWTRPRLEMGYFSPHDLRRTTRSMLASLKCPPDAAEVILGHVLQGVEGTYNQYQYDAEKVEWLTALAARYEQIASQYSAAEAATKQAVTQAMTQCPAQGSPSDQDQAHEV